MAQVSMTTETLIAAANDAEETQNFINGEMNKVDQGRGAVMGSGWQGPAANAFSRLVDAWLAEAKKMVNAIEQFHGQLTSTAQQNVQMEDEQQSQLDSFSAQMGI